VSRAYATIAVTDSSFITESGRGRERYWYLDDEFGAFVQSETDKWANLIKANGIKPE